MKKPYEFKVMPVRECSTSDEVIDTPDRAFAYWQANIPQADWFDSNKETFIVLALNTRKQVIGHNLFSVGTVDSGLVHAREVYRPVIALAGTDALVMHFHPSGAPNPTGSEAFALHAATRSYPVTPSIRHG